MDAIVIPTAVIETQQVAQCTNRPLFSINFREEHDLQQYDRPLQKAVHLIIIVFRVISDTPSSGGLCVFC